MFKRLLFKLILRNFIRNGLQIANDCSLVDMPRFGSEPWLISIGNHVRFSSHVTFITHDGGTWVFRDRPEYRSVIKYGRITIHDNCFIGQGSILMPGISIGPNSVVAAGSVVTKNVPPNSVVGGTPARFLMSVNEYAERCLLKTPKYSIEDYRRDKISEILRIYPRPW